MKCKMQEAYYVQQAQNDDDDDESDHRSEMKISLEIKYSEYQWYWTRSVHCYTVTYRKQ